MEGEIAIFPNSIFKLYMNLRKDTFCAYRENFFVGFCGLTSEGDYRPYIIYIYVIHWPRRGISSGNLRWMTGNKVVTQLSISLHTDTFSIELLRIILYTDIDKLHLSRKRDSSRIIRLDMDEKASFLGLQK